MPVVLVYLAAGRSPATRRALLDAVAGAVGTALDVPRTGIRVLVQEVTPEDYLAGDETLAERTDRLEAP